MASYYVNNSSQSNGDHEVHVAGCSYMPFSKTYLGEFSTCGPAVAKAREYYSRSNGCYYCSPACHTS